MTPLQMVVGAAPNLPASCREAAEEDNLLAVHNSNPVDPAAGHSKGPEWLQDKYHTHCSVEDSCHQRDPTEQSSLRRNTRTAASHSPTIDPHVQDSHTVGVHRHLFRRQLPQPLLPMDSKASGTSALPVEDEEESCFDPTEEFYCEQACHCHLAVSHS